MGIVYNSKEDNFSQVVPTVHGGGGSWGESYKNSATCQRNISHRIKRGELTPQNIQLLKSLGLKLRGKR